jgi:hyperosmotically inducible periplasmic protein
MKSAGKLAPLALLAACGLMAGGSYALPNPAAGTSRPASPQSDSSSDIQREVMHELRMLPYYSVFDDLKYSVNGTTVTLEGDVVNPTTKSDAEGAVKHIHGVTNVVDNVRVLPPSPDDDRIRRAEYRTIYSESQLSKYAYNSVQGIHIIVNNGHVTLEGEVDDQTDKNVANIKANGVPGVFSVTNNLQVRTEK